MNFKTQVSLELFINALLDDIKTGKELTNLAEEIHDIVENVVQDYADDNDIDDYLSSY